MPVGSSPFIGSSSMRKSGFHTSATAIPRRCFMPREKSPVFFERTKKIAEILNIPVILIGNVRDVDTIQNTLNNSKIEYVGLARPLICELDLVKKWKNGDMKKSKCVSCNTCLKNYSTCVLNKNKRIYP